MKYCNLAMVPSPLHTLTAPTATPRGTTVFNSDSIDSFRLYCTVYEWNCTVYALFCVWLHTFQVRNLTRGRKGLLSTEM